MHHPGKHKFSECILEKGLAREAQQWGVHRQAGERPQTTAKPQRDEKYASRSDIARGIVRLCPFDKPKGICRFGMRCYHQHTTDGGPERAIACRKAAVATGKLKPTDLRDMMKNKNETQTPLYKDMVTAPTTVVHNIGSQVAYLTNRPTDDDATDETEGEIRQQEEPPKKGQRTAGNKAGNK